MIDGLISVIIPIYNVENYLEQCINSVLNQTYQNFEIILIDDKSTDKSLEICTNYEKNDSRIKLVRKPFNSGQAASRNIGIKEAIGEYIYFLDSDDYVDSNMFKKIIDKMNFEQLDLCYFSGRVVYDDEQIAWNDKEYIKTHIYKSQVGEDLIYALYKNKEYTCQNCMFITKLALIKDNNIYYSEEIIYEDNLFAFLIALKSKKAGVCNEVFYNRRIRLNSTMTSTNKIAFRIKSLKQVIKDYENIELTSKKTLAIKKSHIRSFCGYIINFTSEINDKDTKKEQRKFFIKNKFFRDYRVLRYYLFKMYIHKGENKK